MKPNGPRDESLQAVEVYEERSAVLTLMAPGWRPADEEITQSYELCFTEGGQMVLAAFAPGRFNLPGGTIEPGESPEQALVREVAEEACATVTDLEYLACQYVWDPENPLGRQSYFQSRWWARVRLDDWDPQFEMIDRTVVDADRFLDTLYWDEKTVAARLLELALAVEENRSRQ